MTAYCCITFPSTYFAIRAEELLKKEPYSFKMVPVPRSISSSCGTALRCPCPELEEIISLLKEHKVTMEKAYTIQDNFVKEANALTYQRKSGHNE